MTDHLEEFNHHGHTSDIRLGSDEVQEADHRRFESSIPSSM